MAWLVFGVSCLLALAGAAAVISGAPIIQLERGWAEVIAGSVAVSSGGVLFALAVILVRLDAIQNALSLRAATVVPAYEPVTPPSDLGRPDHALEAAEESRASDPPGASEPIDEVTAGDAEAETESASGQGLWKRVKRVPESPTTATLEAGGFPDRVVPPTKSEAFREIIPATSMPPVPAINAEQPTEPETPEPVQLGWLERSLFKGRPPKERPEPAKPNAAEPERKEPFPGNLFTPEVRAEPLASPSVTTVLETRSGENSPPTPDAATTPAAGEAQDPDDGVTVIGRYQAGVASYVMYSDGTIEVETEGGQLHRFGSMDELKAFIASQDNALT